MYIHHVSVRVYFPRRASRIKAFLLPLIGIRKEDRNSRARISLLRIAAGFLAKLRRGAQTCIWGDIAIGLVFCVWVSDMPNLRRLDSPFPREDSVRRLTIFSTNPCAADGEWAYPENAQLRSRLLLFMLAVYVNGY